MAKTFGTAAQYPIYATTGPVEIPEQKKMSDIPGGAYVAHDGTPPLRAMFRCLTMTENRLWHRDKQSMFKPQDMFITHLVL